MNALTALAAESEWLDNPVIQEDVPQAIIDTLLMTGVSGLLTGVLGVLVGVLLHGTAPGGIFPQRTLNAVLGAVVNLGRSMPFLILMIALIPVTREIVGTASGWEAACIPLTVGAVPFYARLVETSLREVSPGRVEAALMMGATRWEVVRKVLLPESLPGLAAGFTTTIIALIGYTAMAGAAGAGGLGDIAINHGYMRFRPDVMTVCVVLLVIIVTAVQALGDAVARRLDHR